MKKWILKHWHKLISLQATPEEIASGFAIGIWWGFTPFIGLKTIMAIFTAWISRTNKIAAAIGVTMHDMLLPFFFFVLYFQYKVGCLILHKRPEKIRNIEAWAGGTGHPLFTWEHFQHLGRDLLAYVLSGFSWAEAQKSFGHGWNEVKLWAHYEFHSWVTWEAFYRFCLPVILGAVLVGTLLAFASYFAMKYFVTKFQSEQALMEQLRKTGILPSLEEMPDPSPSNPKK